MLRALAVAQTVDIVIPAAGGSINVLDAYTLNFPANAVCDPNAADTQTGYANQAWDSACTVATEDINVHATLKWQNGVLYADFSPSLRFVPSKNVTISTSVLAPVVKYYQDAGVDQGWSIGFAPSIGASAVNDALNDASLRTIILGQSGKIFRRIKHFTGYMLATGAGYIPCDPNLGNPLCVWVDDGT